MAYFRSPKSVLGVSETASLEECRKAYKKLCIRYHPDNYNGDTDKFDEVQKAWGTIRDSNSSFVSQVKKGYLVHRSLFDLVIRYC